MQTSAVSSSLEVASWFLSRAQDEGQLLEHEKLQYLLFLSQFHYLSTHPNVLLMPSLFIQERHSCFEPNIACLHQSGLLTDFPIRFDKEISNFLGSLIGIMVVVVFLLITGLFLWVFQSDFNVMTFGYANLDSLFILAPWVFLFLVPAVTMRSFAEERRTGTIEMLLTKPLSDWQIVTGKYFAGVVLVIIALLPTLIYYISIYQLSLPVGNVDNGGFWGSYIGLFFLSATFVSIGLFCSSVTNNQILAFILSVFLCGFLYLGFDLIYSMALFGKVDLFIQQLGMANHYSSMSRGVIDTRDLIYFLSVIVLFLSLTKLTLSIRKW